MAETAAPPAPRYVYDLRHDPEFPVLPPEQKMRRIVDLADKDPHFMSMSAQGRKEIIDELLGGAAPGTAAPEPDAGPRWRVSLNDPSLLAPVQEGGAQQFLQGRTQAPSGEQPPGAPQTHEAINQAQQQLQDNPQALLGGVRQAVEPYVTGAAHGGVQAVDEGLMAIPNLVHAGGMALVTPALEALGREPVAPAPGTPRSTALRFMQRPLETLMAGPEGFPTLDPGAQSIQDIVRQTGGLMISSRLASQLVPALKAIPLDDAMIQSLVGTAGKRIGEQTDSEWGPVIGELAGALTAQLGYDGAKKVLEALSPAGQARKALATVVRQTGVDVVQNNIDEAKRLQALVPELKLTPFQAADTPEILAIQARLEKDYPELGQQLRLWRVDNQKLMHEAMSARMGAGGMPAQDAMSTAIEGLRVPYQEKQQIYVKALAQKETEVTQALADVQTAQMRLATAETMGGQAKDQAAAQARQAQAQVEAIKAQRDTLRYAAEDHKLQFAQDRAALLAQAEQSAAGNLAQQPLSYAQRLEATVAKWREIYEQRFDAFRKEATRQSDLIDPQGKVAYQKGAVQKLLDEQTQRYASEGLSPPPALGRIQQIVDEIDGETMSFQDLRNARTRLLEDARTMPYGTRSRTFVQQMDQGLKEAMDSAAQEAGDPAILKRYQDFASFYAKGISRFVDGPGEALLKADYLPKGGRTGAVLPEDYYHLTHGEVLGHLWSNAPIAGAAARGAEKFFDQYRMLVSELTTSPEGMQALKDFVAQDFYEKVVDPSTRQFNPTAAKAWLRDHQAQLTEVPELKALYDTPQGQSGQLAQAEAQSTKLLDQLSQQRKQASRALAQEQRGPLAQAQEAKRVTGETVASNVSAEQAGVAQAGAVLKSVTQTATERAQQAEHAVNEALAEWQNAFGGDRGSMFALNHTAATDALGATPEELIAQINALAPEQRRFALGRLTEPIKNDPQAVLGLRRALWDDYVATHGDKVFDPRLAKDLPLSHPQLVMDWLRQYEGWFNRYSSPQDYNDLMTIARGMKMNSMAQVAGETVVPQALRAATPTTRMFERMLLVPTIAAIESVRRTLPWGLGVGGAATTMAAFWSSLENNQRLTLLREAAFNPDIAHLLSVMGSGKADPGWARTVLGHELSKLALSVGARGSEIADVASGATPRP